tara:strand:- start:10665 stop:10826 length:162 start_codon:yes stop_codon:yes gene_type:complete
MCVLNASCACGLFHADMQGSKTVARGLDKEEHGEDVVIHMSSIVVDVDILILM